jgi:alanine or glycine:cation symporter, AGCS family
MNFEQVFALSVDYLLFAVCLFILLGSILISCKTRFVQLRFFPFLFRMLKNSLFQRKKEGEGEVLSPHKALFTAMSTTLGISTIVSPVIAIHLGGPGALMGYLLTAFFGSALTYVEVNLCIRYREKTASGAIIGGPMAYLKQLLSPKAARFYAICCLILMTAWSGAQSNQLAAILNSPLLGGYRLPPFITGIAVAILVLVTLVKGVRCIGSFSAKLVPMMFVLYLGSSLWILCANLHQMPQIFHEIFSSMFSPYSLASGVLVGGAISALRWGIFKGIQTCEAGVGTQTFPHSMAATQDGMAQGALSMLSTYSAGLMAFLSGCVAMITKTWQDPSLPLGMSMVAASFQLYFSYFGLAIVAISTLLFGYGTILGNSFNGSRCFAYLTSNNKNRKLYFAALAIMIVVGALGEAKFIWSYVDFILALMTIPHMTALLRHVFQREEKEEVIRLHR